MITKTEVKKEYECSNSVNGMYPEANKIIIAAIAQAENEYMDAQSQGYDYGAKTDYVVIRATKIVNKKGD